MMKMPREKFYEAVLKGTFLKPGFNPNFVAQITKDNGDYKKRFLSMQYDKLAVSEKVYGKKFLPVADCPDNVISRVFERIYNSAVEWCREGGLAGMVQRESQLVMKLGIGDNFNRHLRALDGNWHPRVGYPAYFRD